MYNTYLVLQRCLKIRKNKPQMFTIINIYVSVVNCKVNCVKRSGKTRETLR